MTQRLEPKEGVGAVQSSPRPTLLSVKINNESTRNKNVPIISNDVFQTLDPYHRALAQVLQRYGDIVIEGVTPS